eukprot:s3132_g1.t3
MFKAEIGERPRNLMEVLAQRRALQDVPMDLCVAVCQESQLWSRALKLQETRTLATMEGRMKEAARKGWQAVAELVKSNMQMNPSAAHMAMKALSARYCWQLAVELTTTADDSALINQAASTCVRAEHWQEALAILRAKGATGASSAASSVVAGVALDAAQKGLAWQLALLMLKAEASNASNLISWNAAAGACRGHWEVVLALMSEMNTRELRPDVVAYTVAVAACGQSLRWRHVLSLLQESCGDSVTLWAAWRANEAVMRPADVDYGVMTLRDTLRIFDPQRGFSLAVSASQLLWQQQALPKDMQSRGPKPDLLFCSEVLRGLLQITAAGDWHDRDLWRRAMDVLGYMEEETIQPYVVTMNLALEICKDCRALTPVFQIYEVIAPRVRPDPSTFEHLASTCVMAPGQYWWRAIRYMEEAQGLFPQQMTVAVAKSIKACVDASSWSAALFHLGHRLMLDFNPEIPGRAAQMDEAIKNYLETHLSNFHFAMLTLRASAPQLSPPNRPRVAEALPRPSSSLFAAGPSAVLAPTALVCFATRRELRSRRRVALTGDAESPQILRQWRYARRSRLMSTLDWTRYHLWVYFVDGCEPSYARARLARFFFEKVCHGRDTSSLLYCAAGGLETTLREEEGIEVASAVPDLHVDDLQNLALPPFTFVPNDFSMYDVIVAVNEETAQRIREQLPADRDELCVLSDFVDAYDVLREMEEEKEVVTPRPLAPGVLTQEGLAQLKPGEPLRGTPPVTSVGSPLCGLPDGWEELWNRTQRSINAMPGETGDDHPFDEAGRMLHSIVGLERALRASIPPDMRWWNDEDLRAGSLGERGEGITRSIRTRTWSDRWHWQSEAAHGLLLSYCRSRSLHWDDFQLLKWWNLWRRTTESCGSDRRKTCRRRSHHEVASLEKSELADLLLGLELLRSSGTLHFETQKAFRRTRGRSILGLRLLVGYRKRWALDASKLLRNDPLLEYQPELGALGVEETLRFLGFNSGRFRSVRPHRKDRLRLLRRHGTTKLLKARHKTGTVSICNAEDAEKEEAEAEEERRSRRLRLEWSGLNERPDGKVVNREEEDDNQKEQEAVVGLVSTR